MPRHAAKTAYAAMAELAKAMAHPTRLAILHLLCAGEACVCHLTAALGKRQANVSQHLMLLREAQLVTDRRDGNMVYYALAGGQPAPALSLLTELSRSAPSAGSLPALPEAPVPGCPCPKCSQAPSDGR